MVGPREQVTVAGAFPLYMAVFVWRLYRDLRLLFYILSLIGKDNGFLLDRKTASEIASDEREHHQQQHQQIHPAKDYPQGQNSQRIPPLHGPPRPE